MPGQQLFYPDEALVFRSLPAQFQLIHEMGRAFQRFPSKGYPERDALYFAYVETHRNALGIATAARSGSPHWFSVKMLPFQIHIDTEPIGISKRSAIFTVQTTVARSRVRRNSW